MQKVNLFVMSTLLLCLLSISAYAGNMEDFVKKWNGKKCNGGQCVALAKEWIQENKWPAFPGIAYAKDYAGLTIKGHQWIKNSPKNMPQEGDIVVFGALNKDSVGHMSIAYKPTNATTLTSFDQNWPINSACAEVTHKNYKYVLGWYHKT